MINVENLCKNFGSLKVLKNITEHIHAGERVVIIGPSGSGKSTFLRCLNLLETPTSGKIFIDGEEITDPKHNVNLLRQQMGMVFQHFNLFPNYDVLGNITLAPLRMKKINRAEAEDLGMHLLEKVDLVDKAHEYPSVSQAAKNKGWRLPGHLR